MRFVIFTPALKTSAIGRSTSLVTHALTKIGHTVAVVRSEDASLLRGDIHDFGAETVPWTTSKQVEELVRNADSVIYQIGNHYPYHRGCLEWLRRAPGGVCLHDFFLGNLFYGWAQDHMSEALLALQAWYGDKAAASYFEQRATEQFIAATQGTAPMTEWICSMASSVITHSSWGIQRVLDSCPGPVQLVPLAYDAPASATVRVSSIKRDSRAAELNVLTVGHINPNKRAESVIRAIGNSAILRMHTTYRLVGWIQPEISERLASLAETLHVKLLISGEVDSGTLLQAIGKAHVICCLRWPSLEAASASAIEAMLYGRPVVVTDTGFYSELPDGCVRKIRVQNEITDLQQALEYLCENEGERLALGVRAAEWAAATFNVENYARQVVATSLAAQRALPMLKATQSLTGTLWQWGASANLMTSNDITEPLRMFESSQNTPQDGGIGE